MKRTYGLQVEFIPGAYGTNKLVARVLARENNEPHPVNCNTDAESEIWGAPKRMHGLALCGLQVRSFFADDMTRCHDPAVEFDQAYHIDIRKAKAMVRTLLRVEHQLGRDGSPTEHGAVVAAVMKALKLDWCVICTHAVPNSSYSMSQWKFVEPHFAVDMFRASIETRLKPKKREMANGNHGQL